jgi:hypothetical protein
LTGGHKHTRHYLLIMKSACSSTLANGSIDTNEENRDTGRASEKPRLVDGRFGESVEFFWSRSRNPEPHGNTLSRGMRETKAAHIVFVEYKSSVSKIPSAPTIPEANYTRNPEEVTTVSSASRGRLNSIGRCEDPRQVPVRMISIVRQVYFHSLPKTLLIRERPQPRSRNKNSKPLKSSSRH